MSLKLVGVTCGAWGPEALVQYPKTTLRVSVYKAQDNAAWAELVAQAMELQEWAEAEAVYVAGLDEFGRRRYESAARAVKEAAEALRQVRRIREVGTPTYIRYGRLPARERSVDHTTGQVLAGVSVYRGYRLPDGSVVVCIPQGPTWTTVYFVRHRTAYEVAGEEVGTGPDGEPLLRNVRITRRNVRVVKMFLSALEE